MAVCLRSVFDLGLSVLNFWGEEEDTLGRPAERGLPAALFLFADCPSRAVMWNLYQYA